MLPQEEFAALLRDEVMIPPSTTSNNQPCSAVFPAWGQESKTVFHIRSTVVHLEC